MNTVAIIVSARPDMLAVCQAALRHFAPWLPICVVATSPEVARQAEWYGDECLRLPTAGQGAADHAAGIEHAREKGIGSNADIVILLDDDTIVLSADWLPWVKAAFAASPRLGILGGVRSRGLIGQAYVDGVLLVHAHMMAIRGEVFRAVVSTFHAHPEAGVAYTRLDTAALACLDAAKAGFKVRPVPFHEPGMGPLYGPIQATEYYVPPERGRPLWTHLGRGTSFAPRGWWREQVRGLARLCGSPRAAKIIRRQDQRAQFIARSWSLVPQATRQERAR